MTKITRIASAIALLMLAACSAPADRTIADHGTREPNPNGPTPPPAVRVP
ncbi:hypothetical protein [Tanticharoenia sakaeratensis]|jgi:hypothetical protein|uniref:Lipoprotein n=1 Tax=Tanticharoenia sakaeratensis NBRC 103193 TaxID=1231623 RepID=A0A0D6MLC9_9PROT|nr:hypothetical protein [Tanticharoenia sakaeratensis]GAN54467.1 hypothetical protein Tasa_021_048 [Tanticharoenia sakaeratensis NBRC 103193]GBQ24203.1 hypothetical protein AA103193_2669 [Tanticharoenia sakaeratensis NBRC 103193]